MATTYGTYDAATKTYTAQTRDEWHTSFRDDLAAAIAAMPPAPKRYLSAKPQPQPPRFPVGTLFHWMNAAGEFCTAYQNSAYVRLLKRGPYSYGPTGPLLFRDFRRPANLFAHIGSGRTVVIDADASLADAATLERIGKWYGTWLSPTVLKIK